MGLETSDAVMGRYGEWLTLFDHLVLAVFVLELATKLFAFRLGFFSRAWNVFDFIIVGIALIPASGPLAVLRALRVLRVLRLISTVQKAGVKTSQVVRELTEIALGDCRKCLYQMTPD